MKDFLINNFAKEKLIYLLLIVVILFIPKITLISFPNTTTGIRIEDFLIALALLVYIYRFKKYNLKHSEILKKVEKCFYVFFIFSIISVIVGYINGYISLFSGLVYAIRKLEYFVFIYIGYDLLSSKNTNFLKVFDVIILFNLIVVLLQKFDVVGAFNYGKFVETVHGRYYSIFNGAYELSAVLLLFFPYYVNNIIKKKQILKNIIFSLFIFTIIFLSESRSSLVLYFVCIFVMCFLEKRNMKSWKFILLCFICVSIGFFLLYSGLLSFLPRFDTLNIKEMFMAIKYAWENKSIYWYMNNISMVPMYSGGDLSFNIRIRNWMCLIDGFKNNILFGMGPSIVKSAADGAFIRLLAETGILGFVSWIFLLINNIKIKFNNDGAKAIVKYCSILLIIGGLFIDLFDASRVMCYYWFFLGLMLKLDEKEAK